MTGLADLVLRARRQDETPHPGPDTWGAGGPPPSVSGVSQFSQPADLPARLGWGAGSVQAGDTAEQRPAAHRPTPEARPSLGRLAAALLGLADPVAPPAPPTDRPSELVEGIRRPALYRTDADAVPGAGHQNGTIRGPRW